MKLNKYSLFGILLLGVLILNSSSSLVLAADNDGDGVDDDIEEQQKRDVQVQIGSGEFQIESTLRNGARKDEIKLKIGYESEGVSIEIGYEKDISTGNDTELEVEFSVTFRKLIEFVDMDGNGIYNPSIDNTIQEYLINSFHPVVYSMSSISGDTVLHYFIVNTTDGVFRAHIYLAEEFDIINGTFVKPTQTKIDIEISNFNYIHGSSQLALYTKLESGTEYQLNEHTENEEDGHSSHEKSVVTSNVDFAGFFAWAENATIDGISKKVLASPLKVDDDDINEQKMYLNYARGNHIYHDPVMGIMSIPDSPSNIPIIIIISIVSSVGIVGVILVVVLRRRTRKE
ncbi:MAG: hypothetical protein EAX91_09850 [Candidatus Lokiarchaeota archaeon]|nr:hypothetical protein [Candidatus Lokiarchaeota archaeon]